MAMHTFSTWLLSELYAAQSALLTLYEKRDALKYIEGPRLEQLYMSKIGSYEETVIKEEIEVEVLRKKLQMIQIALNRREPIDEAAIDAELEKYRQELLTDAAGVEPREYGDLSDEYIEELNSLYSDIVHAFHPQTHPELTEVERELYEKALEAYRRRDLDALRLISDMLWKIQGGEEATELLMEMMSLAKDDSPASVNEPPKIIYAADYSLCAQIYSCFSPTADEVAIQEDLNKYRTDADSAMAEIEALSKEFPYNTADLLNDPEKIEEYKSQLTIRLNAAAEEKARRTTEIRKLLEGAAVSHE